MEDIRKAEVYLNDRLAGVLEELEKRKRYRFTYIEGYQGPPISLTLPVSARVYEFDSFPAFFDGLLPEGAQLEGLLRQAKLDRNDYFGQLIAVGADMVGAVTVKNLSRKGFRSEDERKWPSSRTQGGGARRRP